jgi:ZIP family zinc transporter
MAQALLFGFIASSALVIGGVLGSIWKPPQTIVGVLLAFASGSLISALAFELFADAAELGGAGRAGIGLLAGAAAFVVANTFVDRWAAGSEEPDHSDKVAGATRRGVGWALLAAVTLDGVPENLALGVSLVEGASYTLLVAIFFSNLPESLVGAVAMREEGRTPRYAISIWATCALALTVAVLLGRGLASELSDETLAVCLAIAGGAVLASLADTLMPEAFEHGRPWNSFATAAGFFLSFVLAG